MDLFSTTTAIIMLFCCLGDAKSVTKNITHSIEMIQSKHFKSLTKIEKTTLPDLKNKVLYHKIPTKMIKIDKNSIYY